MSRALAPVAALLAGFLAGAAPALAGCSDPPAQGVNWQRCNFDYLELVGVDLTEARLRDGSFIRTDLSGAILRGSESHRVKFINAKLVDADLTEAQLYEADLTKADLAGAVLIGADLRRARLFRASLRNADLTGAQLDGADLTRVDFSGALWTDGKQVCAEGSTGRCNRQPAVAPPLAPESDGTAEPGASVTQ